MHAALRRFRKWRRHEEPLTPCVPVAAKLFASIMPDLAIQDFVTALALVLVFEGLSLALMPGAIYRALTQLAALPREALRWVGVIMLFLGVVIVYLIRG